MALPSIEADLGFSEQGLQWVLVYAVVEAPDVGWGDVRTILLFAGSAVPLLPSR